MRHSVGGGLCSSNYGKKSFIFWLKVDESALSFGQAQLTFYGVFPKRKVMCDTYVFNFITGFLTEDKIDFAATLFVM